VVQLKRLKESGTVYGVTFPLFVPRGVTFLFVLPPVCNTFGVLFPASGDPDLMLSLNGLSPIVAASRLGGTARDSVSFSRFCWPWNHFFPFFRVFGFQSSACALVIGGFGLP
jgi:hypothetical protein